MSERRCTMKKVIVAIAGVLVLTISGLLIYFYLDFKSGSQRVDSFRRDLTTKKIINLGTTKTLEIYLSLTGMQTQTT